jgi:hypothetical protein
VSDDERDRIENRVAAAGLLIADAFYDEVRAVRETMAVVSAANAQEPPADLRGKLLAAVASDNVRTLPSARPAGRGGHTPFVQPPLAGRGRISQF